MRLLARSSSEAQDPPQTPPGESCHPGQTAFAGRDGRGVGHRHRDANEHAAAGSAGARRSDRPRRDRREGADDARQRRDAARRNDRAARADDVAGARRGERAHSGAARTLLAARRRRPSRSTARRAIRSVCCRCRRSISVRSKSSRASHRRSTARRRSAASSISCRGVRATPNASCWSTPRRSRDWIVDVVACQAPSAPHGPGRCSADTTVSPVRIWTRRVVRSSGVRSRRRAAARVLRQRQGRTMFATVGVMAEDRERRNRRRARRCRTAGRSARRSTAVMSTADSSAAGCRPGNRVLAVRGSCMRRSRRIGGSELTASTACVRTWFGEASLQGARGRHTWVVGSAFQQDRFDLR